jgi:hypothetical protein
MFELTRREYGGESRFEERTKVNGVECAEGRTAVLRTEHHFRR